MAITQFTTSGGIMLDGVVLLNGTVDINGVANGLILDADGDTHISAPTNNQIDIGIGGADDFTFTANTFNVLAGSTIAGPTSTFGTFIPITSQQALSGAGAINVTSWYTAWTTTGTNAGTLADGVVKGQIKKIQMIVDGGDGTLTPSNLVGGTTITFADAGDYVVLYFNGSAWVMIEAGNAADGATAPVLA
jgi:hypothetical protein